MEHYSSCSYKRSGNLRLVVKFSWKYTYQEQQNNSVDIIPESHTIWISFTFVTGRGSGSCVGGWLISVIGTRASFRLMGFLAIAGGVAYGLLHYFWLRKVELKERDEDVTTAAAGNTNCESSLK
jgi:hypothetical protein